MHTYTHTHTHTHIHEFLHICPTALEKAVGARATAKITRIHIDRYIKTYIHTYTHTYIHTNKYEFLHICLTALEKAVAATATARSTHDSSHFSSMRMEECDTSRKTVAERALHIAEGAQYFAGKYALRMAQ